MTEKKKKRVSVSRVLNQAKESLRLLEALEKETLAKAKTFVKNPISVSRKSLANDTLAASLRSLGVASRAEVQKLERRITELETRLAQVTESLAQGDARPSGKKSALKPVSQPETSPDSFPNT